MEEHPLERPDRFPLSPRQLRLRKITAGLLAVVVVMIAVGLLHPFFQVRGTGVALTPEIRREVARRAIVVLLYWTVCVGFAFAMIVVAYLDLKEIRKRHLLAQIDLIRQMDKSGRGGKDGASS